METSSIPSYIILLSTILSQFIFFLRKNFERTKTRHKQKRTNKTKLSKHKTIKATILRLLRRRKSFILHFGAFFTLKIFSLKKKQT